MFRPNMVVIRLFVRKKKRSQ